MIICASRRTDVPAFHSEWFMNRLRAGYVLVRNPVQRNVVHRISLARRDVDCIFFITKDPRPLEKHLGEIGSMGHMYVFHVTMNPYGRDLEPNVPFRADINDSCIRISERIGRDRMVWRYDPVLFNNRIDIGYHRRKFALFCREASKWTDHCVISFINMYGKLGCFEESGLIRQVSTDEMISFARMASAIAEEHGMTVVQCCGEMNLEQYGIDNGGCLDYRWMSSLGIPYESQSGTIRDGCRCVRCVDVGQYDTCRHGCVYCYANRTHSHDRDSRVYDPQSEMLVGGLTTMDKVVDTIHRSNHRIDEYD